MSNAEFYTGRVAVVGDYNVGKTCLLQRIVNGEYNDDPLPTIALNYQNKEIDVGTRRVKLQFMDTGGNEKFQSMNMIHVRRCLCVLLVYDVTLEESFIHMDKWLKDIEMTAPSDVIKILVGCKNDKDVTNTSVSTDIGQMVAEHFKMLFFEVSAKNNINIKELLDTIAEKSIQLIDTRLVTQGSPENRLKITLLEPPKKSDQGGCIC